MVATFTIGSDTNQSLQSASSEPMDQRGNEAHGNTITVNESAKGAVRYSAESGQSIQTDIQRVTTGEGTTVRSASGQPRAFASKPDDVMSYKGFQTQASILEGMGVVNLNAQGRYEFNDSTDQANPAQAEQAPSDLHDSFAMSDADNAVVNSLIPEGVAQSQLQAVSSHAIAGNLEAAAKSLSQSSGQTPSEATETVNAIAAQYTKASTKYLTDVVKLPAGHVQPFYDYISTQHPAETKAAINAMINSNNFKALGKLVSKYANANPPSAEQLNDFGVKTSKTGKNAATTIKVGGLEMSIASARRAGLI